MEQSHPLNPDITRSGELARFVLLLAILAWAPVPWGSYEGWSRLLLTTALCALGSWHLLSLGLHRRSMQPATRAAAWPLGLLGAFAGWQWLQAATLSIDPAATRDSALLATAMATAALLVTELVSSRRRALAMIWVLLAVGAGESLLAVQLVYSGQQFSLFEGHAVTPGAASGTFFNRNHFAAYMNICLALGVGLMVAQLTEPPRNWRQRLRAWGDLVLSGKVGLRLVLLVLVIGLVLTRSRMGNMGFFVALTGTSLLWALITRRVNRGLLFFLGSIVVLDVTFIGAYFGVEQVAERIQDTAAEGDGRGDLFSAMLPMLADHWLAGTGAGTFGDAFIRYRTPDIGVFYVNAHNDYLQTLVETGVPGALMLGGFWAFCLVRALGLMQSRDRWFRGMGFGGVMLAGYLALHATVEFNLQIPGLALTILCAMTLTGLVIPELRHQATTEGTGRRARQRQRHRKPPTTRAGADVSRNEFVASSYA